MEQKRADRLAAEESVQIIMDRVVSIGNHNKQHEFKRL